MRRTASVISALSVENAFSKKSSTSAYAAEAHVANVRETGGREAGRELVGVRIVRERVREVAIRALRAADESADQRDEPVEIDVERALEERIRCLRDVEVHEASAGFEHASSFSQRADDVHDISHREAHDRAVETAIFERERHHVGGHESNVAFRLAGGALPRSVEHRFAEVRSHDAQRRVRARKMEREVARAAAHIEDASAGRRRELPDGTLAPALVDAARQETIGRIVAGRDRCKHLADVDGFFHNASGG
jgi:hypothetical protein